MLNVYSGVLQKSGGFPVGAIIAICVLLILILCHIILLVWLDKKKKRAKKNVGELMFQQKQLLTAALVYSLNIGDYWGSSNQ